MIWQKRVFLLNNVYFDQKLVSLCSNIRLLGRDEWIFLDKDPEADRQNIIELPHSVTKGLVACRDAMTGVFCDNGKCDYSLSCKILCSSP